MTSGKHFNPLATTATVVVLALMALAALYRIEFETDIVATLPEHDPVIAAARDILRHHPGQDLVAVDLHLKKDDPAELVRITRAAAAAMGASGLFKRVGMQAVGDQMPALIHYVVRHLPLLFSAGELDQRVAPLLTEARVRNQLQGDVRQLGTLEGIGQADLIARDPLALRNLLLAQLARLSPAPGVRPFQGHLISADGRHVLVVATPSQPSTDTNFARRLAAFFQALPQQLQASGDAGDDAGVIVTPVGAYRAALDNEMLARRDTRRIVGFAMAGIALLLFLTFPRPWIGLLAFVPAVAGTVTALFVMSLLQARLSVLTLGFGGAVISITVDHGIAYLLFLDRRRATTGREAAREVLAVGLIATLTTVGAFLALSFSGFPVLGEIGRFAAIGIGSAFVFVHTVMPHLIPSLPPARRKRQPVLQRQLARLAGRMDMKTFWAGAVVVVVLALCAHPRFQVDLRAMNSVTPATREAEARVQDVWGRFMERVFVVTHGKDLKALMEQGDRVTGLLDKMTAADQLEPGFLPTAFFPGPARAAANRAAWQAFWTPPRIAALSRSLKAAGQPLGFAPQAFVPFLEILRGERIQPVAPDPAYFELLGIVPDADGTGWRQFFTLKPGPDYDAAAFYGRLTQAGAARLFDPVFFADRLGHFLAVTFRHMLLVVGGSAVVLLGFFFWDLTLTALALLPLAAAFAGTLGVLGLAGRPLDIPALMLAIIVLGMGIDYALFTIRAFQRYGRETDPELALFRTTVFLAAASTLVGFGALMSADHAVFKSAGLTSFCGILFSAVGAFVFLPPLLRRLFRPPAERETDPSRSPEQAFRAARRRFRHLELRPRLAAWHGLRPGGPLRRFPLPESVEGPIAIFPLGCGVEAAWLAEALPGRPLLGADPEGGNTRLAARVGPAEADFRTGGIETLAEAGPVDNLVLLPGQPSQSDDAAMLLAAADRCLAPGGRLIVLAGTPAERSNRSWGLNRLGPSAPDPYNRQAVEAFLEKQGYRQVERRPAGSDLSLVWIAAQKS
jgi:uncharacterized protein